MSRSIGITVGCLFVLMMAVAPSQSAETKSAQNNICSQIRTKAECQNQAGCKLFKGTDGKHYCIPDTRDYPPYKGGYPLD